MHSKEFPWAQYKPKDGILVVQPVWITEREIQFLMQLYAPFIGKEATLLYATLYGELSPSEYESEVFSISELLSMTNLGMPDFYLAKTRLEGIGLLKTYRKEPTASRPQNVHDGITSTNVTASLFQRCLTFDITVKPNWESSF